MDGSKEATTCDGCGLATLGDDDVCTVCGTTARSSESSSPESSQDLAFRVLENDRNVPIDPPLVDIVRQLKMPTIDHLDLDAERTIEVLPGAAQSVEDAVEAEDYAAADEVLDGMLDGALGTLLDGPGHERRRRPGLLVVTLWAWIGVLAVLFIMDQLRAWLGTSG